MPQSLPLNIRENFIKLSHPLLLILQRLLTNYPVVLPPLPQSLPLDIREYFIKLSHPLLLILQRLLTRYPVVLPLGLD